MFGKARVVLGFHGGGLTNLFFSSPGTVVIELSFTRSNRLWRSLKMLTHMRGHDLVWVPLALPQENMIHPGGDPRFATTSVPLWY